MIRVEIKEYIRNRNEEYINFKCPICGFTDIAYINMPKACYKCGADYKYDLPDIVYNLKARLKYHFEEDK